MALLQEHEFYIMLMGNAYSAMIAALTASLEIQDNPTGPWTLQQVQDARAQLANACALFQRYSAGQGGSLVPGASDDLVIYRNYPSPIGAVIVSLSSSDPNLPRLL